MAGQRRCDECRSPLDREQRYCLTCGARAGERSPRLNALLAKVAARAAVAPAAQSTEPQAAVREPLHLPGPRISAVLVAVFVAFGALIGNAVAGETARPPRAVRLVVPGSEAASTHPPSGGSGEAAGGEGGGGSGGGGEAPEAAPEATPAPAAPGGTSSAASQGGGSGSSENKGGGGESGSATKPSSQPAAPARKLTSIKHVFLIVLSDQPYANEFGELGEAHYLSHILEAKGEVLLRYDAIAHEQLPNEIALLSGQGPTPQTAADCPTFSPLAPGSAGPDEQALGDGCVYPSSVRTLPGQLEAKHLSWRAYVEGIAEAGQPGPCSHPAAGAADPSVSGGPYATYRNPFVYFEAITDATACQTSDVGISKLKPDLTGSAASAPALSYIVPDRCHDGSPAPCSPGAPAGPALAGSWLEGIVPSILDSKSYKQGGLLVITSDEAPSAGEFADSSACCGQPSYPNYTSPEIDHGGGDVGALLLSPFIKGGTSSQDPYDHFSLLRTIEDIFGVHHLGYAALPAVKPLSPSLLNAPAKG